MAKLKTLSSKVKPIDTRRAKHKVIERERGRPAARARERVLKRDRYLCLHCLEAGRVTPAEEVDHITPLHLGGADSDDNKQSLCRSCHAAKTAQEARERA